MGERYLYDDLIWHVEKEAAVKRLHVSEDDIEDFEDIYERTVALMRPVFYVGRERVNENDGESVTVGNERFTSRVVSVNLKKANSEWVYPYVGTSGRAAYEYARTLDDDLFKYWSDQICEMALKSALVDFIARVRELSKSERLSALAPGSVIDWHISQQKKLFELLGNVYDKTGILLEESFLMRPVKSNSGILYASDGHFVSCSLCSKQNCPNRKAPFDKDKFEREYMS